MLKKKKKLTSDWSLSYYSKKKFKNLWTENYRAYVLKAADIAGRGRVYLSFSTESKVTFKVATLPTTGTYTTASCLSVLPLIGSSQHSVILDHLTVVVFIKLCCLLSKVYKRECNTVVNVVKMLVR